jgi:hypothetical protein
MLRIRPSFITAKSVPLIGLSVPSGPRPQEKRTVVAVAVRLADQLEFEIRETLLHAGHQRVDAVQPLAAHQRIDVFRIRRPVLAKDFAATARRPLVPRIDIVAGNRVASVIGLSFDFHRMDRLVDYRRSARANRLPRRSRI